MLRLPLPGRRPRLDVGVPASLILHLVLAIVVLKLPAPQLADSTTEQNIDVEVISDATLITPAEGVGPAVVPNANQQPLLRNPSKTPPEIQNEDTSSRTQPMIQKPVVMLSAQRLADPRSRTAKAFIEKLEPEERASQLCDIEAMAQIAAWNASYHPETVVAYAKANTALLRNVFTASGAAFQSAGVWFDLQFRCELTPDKRRVVSFEFLVGAAVPRKSWARYNLPGGGSHD